MRLKIAGGFLFDPASGRQGDLSDLYIENDRIVSPLPTVDRVIAANGQVVMAGGIDLRGQVATYGLNYLRLRGLMPTARRVGELYAAAGYTHVHEPFLTLYTANYVHRELAALPLVDTSASFVVNLRDLDLLIQSPERWPEVGKNLHFLLGRTRCLNLHILEPYVTYRQDFYTHRIISTAKTLEFLTELARELNLKIILEATPEVLQASFPNPQAFHLAALGPALHQEDLLTVALSHLEQGTTADMGLIRPHYQLGAVGLPIRIDLGLFHPLELCPAPLNEAARLALTLALQYSGQGLAFSGADALRMPVRDYPYLFDWLGNNQARRQDWGEELDSRQYSLTEIAWATRNLPARLLGLTDRGNLGIGARADVAIFDHPSGTSTSPGLPPVLRCHTLIKAGQLVIDNFHLLGQPVPKATYYRPTETEATPLLGEFCQYHSLRLENLGVAPSLGVKWALI
jgi:formylmethanofuran dehydrogenase subunit A